jgi:RNA polymerase sigma-70 factor (ECF subfamily)
MHSFFIFMTVSGTPTRGDLRVLLPRLRRYARVLTADLNRADELVLETLSLASGRQSPPAPGPQLGHWLFAIMHRLHRESLVREPGMPRSLPAADRRVAGAREFRTLATRVERVDNDETLARFSRLPSEQREVLALVVLEGLLYTEVADVLGVPVGTVMSRMHSAREGMRSHLSVGPVRN